MDKSFDAVKMSRELKERVSRKLSKMSSQQRIAYLNQHATIEALRAKIYKEKHLPKAA